VNQCPLVGFADCRRETDSEVQKRRHLHRPRKESIERFAARIFKYERYLTASL
jgi:hypothetical protein